MPTSSSRIPEALKRKAISWAGQLTSISKEFAPDHLKQYIHTKVVDNGDGGFTLTLYVDTMENPIEKYGSLDAAAQEFGSGIRGGGEMIPILPKNRKFLAFNWEVANNNPERFRFLPDGRVILSYVRSPGIFKYKGAGYMGIAIEEFRAVAEDELDIEMQNAITGDIRAAFSHAE